MATSLADILAALQNGVTAIQTLTKQIATTFPVQVGAITTVAPSTVGGTVFTSSEAAAFMTVTASSGYAYRIPLYPSG